MSHKSYFGFGILTATVILTFVFLIAEPHNFYEPTEWISDEVPQHELTYLDSSERVEKALLPIQETTFSKLRELKKHNRITTEQEQTVSEKIENSYYEQRSYAEYSETEKNTLIGNNTLYLALWQAHQATLLLEYYQFNNCVTEVNALSAKYTPVLHYLSSQEVTEIQYLNVANERYSSFIEHFSNTPADAIAVKKDILAEENTRNDQQEDIYKCELFVAKLNKDYHYQSSLLIFKIVLFVTVFTAIFFAGKTITLKRIKKAVMSLQSKSKKSETVWTKTANENAIDAILKVSSVMTIMVTVAGLFISAMGKQNVLFFIIPTVSVCTLLASILIGIMAINSNSPRLRLIAYRLFMAGMILFIVVILEIVFFIGVATVWSTIKQSVVTTFTNHTGI